MGRRSIVLLVTFAVLLQPAFASVCMMQCPKAAPMQPAAQPSAGHSAHTHHHAAVATNESTASITSGACNKTMDLRSSAIPSPTTSIGIHVDSAGTSPMSIAVEDAPTRVANHSARPSAPIVVPLRI